MPISVPLKSKSKGKLKETNSIHNIENK
uniref:Uncharacterized protein n=1 Tax=Rhizophora mucronata TaxID=61149 RepID=A0A2P2P431_RHIMU